MSDFAFTVGAELPAISQPSNLVTSVMYAGASTDWPICRSAPGRATASRWAAGLAVGNYGPGRLRTSARPGAQLRTITGAQAQPLRLSWLTVWSVILPRKIRKKSLVKARFVA